MFEKILTLLKKYWIFILIFVFAIVPFIINVLFKHKAIWSCMEYEASAGDAISAYAAILSAISAIVLGYIAYNQNESSNIINEKMLKLEERMLELEEKNLKIEESSKKSYVIIDEASSYFDLENKGKYYGELTFQNISGVPMVEWDICEVKKILIKRFDKNEPVIIEKNLDFTELAFNYDTVYLSVKLSDNEVENFIVSFELILTSVYGFKTHQVVNLYIDDGMMKESRTVELFK